MFFFRIFLIRLLKIPTLIKYHLLDKAEFVCGDLFENVKGKFDVIIFNHPFFEEFSDLKNPITRAWFNNGELIQKFLKEAINYLNNGGVIIMPFFPFAGQTNNPGIQGEKNGYVVKLLHKENEDDQNLQKGEFCVFSLQRS
jgi:hypothetical protein